MPRAKFQPYQQYDFQTAIFAKGVTSGTTDNSGSLVVTHSLASAPTTVIANPVFEGQSVATAQYSITVVNRNASGSTLRFYGTGSGLVANGTAVTASWVAWV